MSEIEETFQRISQRPNVTGIIVVNNEGTPIRSTIEDTATQNQYAHLITALAAKARHCVRDLDPTNDLSFLRIRSKKNEIMVAPDKDFTLIVIQRFSDGIPFVPFFFDLFQQQYSLLCYYISLTKNMLAILEVVRHVFWNDTMYDRNLLPLEESLEKCSTSLADLSTMTGSERINVFQECGIQSSLYPVFIRALQHLTALHGSGKIDDDYMIHRHMSAKQWSPFLPTTQLIGYPFVNSNPFPTERNEARRPHQKGRLVSRGKYDGSGIHYNGLLNQGATCYLNSLLQALFHISEFRLTIYQMPTVDEAEEKSDVSIKTTKSIPYALQRLFCLLQTGREAVDTSELTESFGWSSNDSFIQHDVHELTSELLDNLENKLKNVQTPNRKRQGASQSNNNAISNLFVGVLENFVRVDEVGYYGSREELFYDLQLVVKHTNNIYASFDKFFQVEVLDGKNKYCLEHDDNKTYHRAEKGVRLKRTPLIMLLHLARFDYDLERGETKVLSRWDYYSTLDLSSYMPHATEEETHYTLSSVLVHSGSQTGFGHYFCFVKCSGSWYRFNDEVVSSASLREVFGANFGGYKMNFWGSEVPNTTNAYMLVYIRTSEIDNLLRPVGPQDVPRHVAVQLDSEQKEYERRLKEEAEDHLYGRIHFIFPHDMIEQDEFISSRRPSGKQFPSQRTFRALRSSEALPEFVSFVEKNLDVTSPDQLLWYASARDGNDRVRLHKRVVPHLSVSDVLCGEKECCVLVTDSINSTYINLDGDMDHTNNEYDLFLHKLYLPLQLDVIFLGCTVLCYQRETTSTEVVQIMEPIIQKKIVEIPKELNDKKYNHDLMQNVSKEHVVDELDLTVGNFLGTPLDKASVSIKEHAEREVRPLALLCEDEYHAFTKCASRFHSGDLFVWQEEITETERGNIFYPDIISFQHFLRHRMSVEIKLNLPPSYPTLIDTQLADDMTYEQLQRYVARLIGDPESFDRIRFTMQNPETKLPYFMKGRRKDRPTLARLLTPAVPRFSFYSKHLYYESCKYTVTEIEAAHSLQFKFFSDRVKPISEHWILMPLDVPITAKELFGACVKEIRRDHENGVRATSSISSLPTTPICIKGDKEKEVSVFSQFVDIEPDDAWKVLRLVDVWRGRVYNVFDKDHPQTFAGSTFEESAEYRIEHIPLPIPDVSLERQYLIQVHHFTTVRQRANPVETHGDPFSLYIDHDEFLPVLLKRIASKLGLADAAVIDWKVALVREHNIVEVLPGVPMGEQLQSFCSEHHYRPNQTHSLKMAFLGLEHAPLSKRSLKKEDKVMILN